MDTDQKTAPRAGIDTRLGVYHQNAYHRLHFVVLPFATYSDVLACYLALNASGTPHSTEEIRQVRDLLAAQTNTGSSP